MTSPEWLKGILRCPETHQPLVWSNDSCSNDNGKGYRFIDDILSFIDSSELSGQDAKWNRFYNIFAPLYDLNERVMGKLIAGVDMAKEREEIISQLNLKPGMRLLEVSPGPGVFQKLLRGKIGLEAEYAALDLSFSMLRQCQIKNGGLNIELIHADAQFLPFAENSFDALFHFGGVNLFNDPHKALQEFIRVTKPGGMVSWGDEGFSDDYPNTWRKKFLPKINPGYLKKMPPIPETVEKAERFTIYGGLGYLVISTKK